MSCHMPGDPSLRYDKCFCKEWERGISPQAFSAHPAPIGQSMA